MQTLSADAALAWSVRQHSLTTRATSVDRVAADLVGLHNTTPFGPHLSLRARIDGFSRADLDGLMWDTWRLVRFRAMRTTMFVMPHDLLEISAAATRQLRASLAAHWLRDSGLSQAEFDQLAAEVESALEGGPLTVRQLRAVLHVPQSVPLPGVVSRMCDVGRLAGGAPPRSWRSSVRRYHRWQDVLAGVDVSRWEEQAAIQELVRRYVSAYAPVTIDDIAWWTGITKGRCRRALEGLSADLEEIGVEDWPGPLLRWRSDGGAAELGDSVAVLPLLDPYVQGYRDRRRFLDPARHGFVYDGGGNAAATVVHRGRIIGVWQFAKPHTVRYHLFDRQPVSVRRAVATELAAAGAMYFEEPANIAEDRTMEPLSARGGRSAAHPLDGQRHRAGRRSQV